MFEEQIKKLIKNIPERITREALILDIVLEGGGFNGSYELGIMYLIKELVRKEYIKVERISGASIGSVVGLCYLIDKMDIYIEKYELTREKWREKINLKVVKELIEDLCNLITEEKFNEIKSNKLYITYYSLKTKKQIIKSEYINKEDLKESIIKSCYLPYIIDEEVGYKCEEQYFIDGGHPYIFHNREKSGLNKILYISINQIKNIPSMITTKNENNIYGRVLKGILDSYNFFVNYNNGNYKKSELCSFVNEWSSIDYIGIYTKQILIIIVIYIIYYIHKLGSIIKPYIEDKEIYKMMNPILSNIYKDIILYMCF
jgi:predicted patatin/cPLA2 family phospholipase